jgi:hypothetical protein
MRVEAVQLVRRSTIGADFGQIGHSLSRVRELMRTRDDCSLCLQLNV